MELQRRKFEEHGVEFRMCVVAQKFKQRGPHRLHNDRSRDSMPTVECALQMNADADLRARANKMSGGRIHSAHTAMVREVAKDDCLPDAPSTKNSAALATSTYHICRSSNPKCCRVPGRCER